MGPGWVCWALGAGRVVLWGPILTRNPVPSLICWVTLSQRLALSEPHRFICKKGEKAAAHLFNRYFLQALMAASLPSQIYSRLPPSGLTCGLSTHTPGRPAVNHSSCWQGSRRLQLSPSVGGGGGQGPRCAGLSRKPGTLFMITAGDVQMEALVLGGVLGWRCRLALVLGLEFLFQTGT